MSMFHASPSGVRPCRCPHVVVMLCQDSIGRVAIVRGATRSYSPSDSTIATACRPRRWLAARVVDVPPASTADATGLLVAESAKQGPHVLPSHRHTVSGARDEPELHTRRRIKHGEDLLVSVLVDDHVSEQWNVG